MFGDASSFCRRIAKQSRLLEGEQGIRNIILEMYRRQDLKLSNKALARIVQIPVPVLSAVRGELLKAGFLKTKSLFTSDAIEWIKTEFKLIYSFPFFQEFITSLHNPLPQKYNDFFRPVVTYLDQRPPPAYEYDQSRSTCETVLKRAMLMLLNGDVEGKRIVILGDDDGVSLALAHLRCAKEILVLDIDPRIVELIDFFGSEHGLSSVLRPQLCDLVEPVPRRWRRRYDTFETDPPYTVPGFRLFVERALNLLDPLRGGNGYISFGNKSPHSTWLCQQYLLEAGFTINEYIPRFNEYIGATILGNSSNLYVVSTVPQKYSIVEGMHPNRAIYTADEKLKKGKAGPDELPTVGFQIIAEFYGIRQELLTNAPLLTDILKRGISSSQLKLDELFVKEYTPFGLSIIAILVESHCHLHTWPEHGYLALDLFVCEEQEKAENLFRFILHELEPEDYHSTRFFRGSRGRLH